MKIKVSKSGIIKMTAENKNDSKSLTDFFKSMVDSIDKKEETKIESEPWKPTCHKCQQKHELTDNNCPTCGVTFYMPIVEGFAKRISVTVSEGNKYSVIHCKECKNIVEYNDEKCPNCGQIFTPLRKHMSNEND